MRYFFVLYLVYFALNEMYMDRVLMVSRTQHYVLGMSGLLGQLKNLARLGRRVCVCHSWLDNGTAGL